jgi:hypothetical protein
MIEIAVLTAPVWMVSGLALLLDRLQRRRRAVVTILASSFVLPSVLIGRAVWTYARVDREGGCGTWFDAAIITGSLALLVGLASSGATVLLSRRLGGIGAK